MLPMLNNTEGPFILGKIGGLLQLKDTHVYDLLLDTYWHIAKIKAWQQDKLRMVKLNYSMDLEPKVTNILVPNNNKAKDEILSEVQNTSE